MELSDGEEKYYCAMLVLGRGSTKPAVENGGAQLGSAAGVNGPPRGWRKQPKLLVSIRHTGVASVEPIQAPEVRKGAAMVHVESLLDPARALHPQSEKTKRFGHSQFTRSTS